MKNTPEQPRKAHPLGLLHRYGGVSAALFVIYMCVTGILLNHTDALKLSAYNVRAGWLLEHYGITVPDIKSYSVDDRYLSVVGTTLYLGTEPLGTLTNSEISVYRDDGLLAALAGEELHYYSSAGQLVEVLRSGATVSANALPLPATELPADLRATLLTIHRGNTITLERLVLDLHAGRIAGPAGVWLADAIAVLFIALALTGLWMWNKSRRRRAGL